MTRPKVLRDRHTELILGGVLFVASSWLFYDAYENRGRKRPFFTRILPTP